MRVLYLSSVTHGSKEPQGCSQRAQGLCMRKVESCPLTLTIASLQVRFVMGIPFQNATELEPYIAMKAREMWNKGHCLICLPFVPS